MQRSCYRSKDGCKEEYVTMQEPESICVTIRRERVRALFDSIEQSPEAQSPYETGACPDSAPGPTVPATPSS
jgi:hypothetical protein